MRLVYFKGIQNQQKSIKDIKNDRFVIQDEVIDIDVKAVH